MNNKNDKKTIPLDGHGTKSYAKKENPVSKKQKAIIEAIEYYFDVKLVYTNAKSAYNAINKYEDRIRVSYGKKIYIDGKLIHNDGKLLPNAPKASKPVKPKNACIKNYESDIKDMSDWDDDDWINFELEH